MAKRKTGIYKITNTTNGKEYIGQAEDIERRWKEHISHSKNMNYRTYLYHAMRKYGVENFSFEIIEECSIEELDEREKYFIRLCNSYENGYNMTLGGDGIRGFSHSEETKEKMSEAKRGSKNNMYGITSESAPCYGRSGDKHPMYGKKHSEESLEKMSKTLKNRTISEEHRLKISESKKGFTHTEETKSKISSNHADFSRGKSPSAKKVVCEDNVFDCIMDCAEYYGINYGTMKAWLRTNKIPQKFANMGLKYKEGEENAKS